MSHDIPPPLSLLISGLYVKDPVEGSQEGLEDGVTTRQKELSSPNQYLECYLLLGVPR